ncbi:VOC family protein [Anatilimnocola floriformis]|uniref:VOC family protein n=1 Tax=Anatilimnocola floriformis TaxID=2948575 RepID=UPI0020C2A3D3|nr:VOC family protein [Anatilimnocola floriformis]
MQSAAAKFHISLSVANLPRAVAFYRALFDLEPAKQYPDYAKFELEDPPVIFSITPHTPGPPGGVLSHAGLKVASPAEIERIKLRLEAAGYATECQQGAVCGYRRLDKIHIDDPDGTHWEVYVVEEEVAPETIQRSLEGEAARAPIEISAAEEKLWEHFVTNPFPDRIPHADGELDEVRLVGTFNASLTDEQQRFLLKEARRVLKPGGKVLVHGLMADKKFPGAMPLLPGLAAMVSRVPVQTTPMSELQQAGFVGLQITKYSGKAWFVHDGVELREVKILAWQPAESAKQRRVLYKGPFAEAIDDAGVVYRRGQRVAVDQTTWDLLRRGAAAENFLFLDLQDSASCS